MIIINKSDRFFYLDGNRTLYYSRSGEFHTHSHKQWVKDVTNWGFVSSNVVVDDQ